MAKLRKIYELFFRPRGVYAFLNTRDQNNIRVLDVGSGNDSAYQYKTAFPDIYYMGLDVGDYNNDHNGYEDEKVIVDSAKFSTAIQDFKNVNTIISRHNLEHCSAPEEVLCSMSNVLEQDGMMFLAFPNPASINFPSRSKTLNYYDDNTHHETPPHPDKVVNILKENGLEIIYFAPQYRPLMLRLIGFLQEPLSWYFKKVYQGTWAYYGFECIIWARKQGR